MKYRKKPIIVDAFKWTDDPDGKQEPSWFTDELNVGEQIDGHLRVISKNGGQKLRITTQHGLMFAEYGDYIIKYETGDISVLSSTTFEATYEKVEG